MSEDNHFVGAAAEMLVASWFLNNGYEVWLPVMTQSRSDLVVSNAEGFRRVQVKKGTWGRSGRNEYLQVRLIRKGRWYTPADYDLLAVVDDTRLWLVPHEEIRDAISLCLDRRGPGAGKGRNKEYDPERWRVL